jgi:hypothetical protein
VLFPLALRCLRVPEVFQKKGRRGNVPVWDLRLDDLRLPAIDQLRFFEQAENRQRTGFSLFFGVVFPPTVILPSEVYFTTSLFKRQVTVFNLLIPLLPQSSISLETEEDGAVQRFPPSCSHHLDSLPLRFRL